MKAIRPATEVLVALAVLAILIVGGIAASKILPGDEPKRAAVGAAVDGSDRHLYQLADKGSASVTGVSDRQLYQQAKKTLTGVAQAPDRQLYQLMKHGTSGSQPVLNVQQIEEARWAAYAKEAQRLNGTAVEGSDRHLYQLAEQVRTSGGQPVLNVQQIEEARWAAYAKEAQRLNATAVEGSDRHLYQLAEQVRISGEPSLTAKQIEDARWAEYVKSAQEAWSDGPRSPCIRHCFAHR